MGKDSMKYPHSMLAWRKPCHMIDASEPGDSQCFLLSMSQKIYHLPICLKIPLFKPSLPIPGSFTHTEVYKPPCQLTG